MPRARPTLRPVSMPGEVYGAGQEAIQAQKAVPLPNAQAAQAPQPQAAPAPNAAQVLAANAAAPRPPIVPLDAPSQNPGEHIMAGAPTGPGPGPEVLAPPLGYAPGSAQDLAARVRAVYEKFQNPNLLGLIALIESNTPPPPQINSR